MVREQSCLTGFTLGEVMVVIVILGVLAALALPNFQIQMMKVKNQEAIQVLLALYGAQKDYAKEHDDGKSTTFDYANSIDQLDVDTQGLKNFVYPPAVMNVGDNPCDGGSTHYLASLTTTDGSYILYVLEDATIVCSNSGGTCSDSLCTKMGFR